MSPFSRVQSKASYRGERLTQRVIVIHGERIAISILGVEIETLFERFYAAYFERREIPWDDIAAAAREYFTLNPTLAAAHDDYFNNFISLWRKMMQVGTLLDAETVWQRALQPAIQWEQETAGRRLHKGTPYYFWAMTAIIRRDMDRGYLIVHKALEEDILTSGHPRPDTPGFALVSMNHEKTDQAFRVWALAQAQFVTTLLEDYNATHRRNFTLADLKQKFLSKPPTLDALFLFTYTLARIMNITDAPEHARTNSFAGQLELNLLFDIALVTDSAIKAKNVTKWKFIDHTEYLLMKVRHPLNIRQLGAINELFQIDFDGTLQRALGGTLTVPSIALDRYQCDAALAYGLRNNGAHNINTAPTVWNRFADVQKALFRVFFATIEHLH